MSSLAGGQCGQVRLKLLGSAFRKRFPALVAKLYGDMASVQHALQLALALFFTSAVSACQLQPNYVPVCRDFISDPSGSFFIQASSAMERNWGILMSTFEGLKLDICVLNPSQAIPSHTTCMSHCMVDHLHSSEHPWLCSLNTCYCSPASFHGLHAACYHRRTAVKFGNSHIHYYSNSVATFNICLSGDVETNPGPEASSNPSPNTNFQEEKEISLDIYHQNVRSLKNKLDCYHSVFLGTLYPLGQCKVFALTETWLSADVLDAEIAIPDFTIFRKDRVGRRGGGVLLGCHNSFQCRRRTDLELNDVELIWVEVKLSARNKLLTGVVYRPPGGDIQPLLTLADSLVAASRE